MTDQSDNHPPACFALALLAAALFVLGTAVGALLMVLK
jgi:hypothetical protein